MRFLSFAWIFVCTISSVFAAEAENNSSQALDAEIKSCIAELDQSSYAARMSASRKLKDAGAAAFPALAELAKNSTGDARDRALDLLKSSLKSPDRTTKEAARKSLDEIAAGSSKAARFAQQILSEHDKPPELARHQAMRPNIQVQANLNGLAPVGGMRMFQFGVNGRHTLTVTNPDNKIRIEMDAAGRIKMDVTTNRLGKEVTERVEAANVDELKTKSETAHRHFKTYESYLKRRVQAAGPAVPLPMAPFQIEPPAADVNGRARVVQSLDGQIELMKRRIAAEQNPKVVDVLNRHLERVIQSRDRINRDLNPNPK